ncbi:response regulator [Clostridiaceae bacterium]|nr:response regulator [Clostridiaceae bacterium]
MEKKHSIFYTLIIVTALTIICLVTALYVRQLDRTISDNIINEISEIAAHDKSTIQSYIEMCWEDLYEIHHRLASDGCDTIEDVEARLNLECASSSFTHIYLVAENGAVYTDKFVTYVPDSHSSAPESHLPQYFSNNRDKVVARFDDKIRRGRATKGSILYGVRLDNYEVNGIKMFALIGISDISSIQDKMVIDSFIKDGKIRGHSALIDMEGNYIVDINKKLYLNKWNNLFDHLAESKESEMTSEELSERLSHLETFGFYHSHEEENSRELFYFIPFDPEISLYFIMSVNEEVFMEQTRTFVTMSMAMLAISMLTVISMLLIVMRYQNKTILASKAAKSQKEFLSNMSHEIRTPLNGLIGMNHLIMAHIDDDSQKPQIKEWLKKSHSTAGYLLSLVNDILDMSKLQAGKADILREPLLVDALIDEIAAMQADNIAGRGVEFIVEKDITEPCIEGDATHIKQILMNIVGNAAKFTPKGKSIRLSVSQEKTDDAHVITIYRCEDTGIGISREYIGKIFDSFSQERNRNTNGIKGTGLGMAISKLLANAMGGDITVESEINVGSIFTVRLPSKIVAEIPGCLKEREGDMSIRENGEPMGRFGNRPVKILVAEDVELNAEILMEILTMEGFDAVHARDGREAVELFRESEIGEFDIILMDMQMPVMDGCSACAEIRRMDRADAKSVVIYACTANIFKEDRDRAMESGMNDFLTKPVDIGGLLKKMGRTDGANDFSKTL